MTEFCSPETDDYSYTCFSNDSLIKIAKSYNNDMNHDIINIPSIVQLNDSDIRRKLWESIKNAMLSVSCEKDYCLLNHDSIKKLKDSKIDYETFRPVMPETWNENMNTWLSTIDIMNVMKQYEKKHRDFLFIGPVPIDFNYKITFGMCISNELCNFSLEKFINSGKKKLGVIFNLDPHFMGGSHWVALFSDIYTGGVYFFDSYGVKPRVEIQKFMEKIKKQGNDLILRNKIKITDIDNEHKNQYEFEKIDEYTITVSSTRDIYVNDLIHFSQSKDEDAPSYSINTVKYVTKEKIGFYKKIDCLDCKYIVHKCFKIFYNSTKFQYENSECGVYSMHFIEEFLNGKKYKEIISNPIHDTVINEKRRYYYRPNKN